MALMWTLAGSTQAVHSHYFAEHLSVLIINHCDLYYCYREIVIIIIIQPCITIREVHGSAYLCMPTQWPRIFPLHIPDLQHNNEIFCVEYETSWIANVTTIVYHGPHACMVQSWHLRNELYVAFSLVPSPVSQLFSLAGRKEPGDKATLR